MSDLEYSKRQSMVGESISNYKIQILKVMKMAATGCKINSGALSGHCSLLLSVHLYLCQLIISNHEELILDILSIRLCVCVGLNLRPMKHNEGRILRTHFIKRLSIKILYRSEALKDDF